MVKPVRASEGVEKGAGVGHEQNARGIGIHIGLVGQRQGSARGLLRRSARQRAKNVISANADGLVRSSPHRRQQAKGRLVMASLAVIIVVGGCANSKGARLSTS